MFGDKEGGSMFLWINIKRKGAGEMEEGKRGGGGSKTVRGRVEGKESGRNR